MKDYWLEILMNSIKQSDEFFFELDYQLSKQFNKVVPESINEFKLVPPFNQQFVVQNLKEFSFLDAELLNIDIVFSVQIAWKEFENKFEFWWLTLPAQQIKIELNNRRQIKTIPDLPFEVQIKNPVWPHLKFTLHSKDKLNIEQIQHAIYELIEQWNEKEFKKGVIHTAKPLIQIDENMSILNIDLGSTGEEFLNNLLEEFSSFNLDKLTIDSQ